MGQQRDDFTDDGTAVPLLVREYLKVLGYIVRIFAIVADIEIDESKDLLARSDPFQLGIVWEMSKLLDNVE